MRLEKFQIALEDVSDNCLLSMILLSPTLKNCYVGYRILLKLRLIQKRKRA
jgi:hypothetical protein